MNPSTGYVFLVRAENVHGLSVPSGLSNVIRTLKPDTDTVPPNQLSLARSALSLKVNKNIDPHTSIAYNKQFFLQTIDLIDAIAINSTSVRLDWTIRMANQSEKYIEVSI